MILYSRNDCPLCEEVEDSLNQLNLSFKFIDIDLNQELRTRYHVKVPVLVNHLQQELGWPFTDSELIEFSKR